MVMAATVIIRLVLLPISLLVIPGLSSAEPAPTPRYIQFNEGLVGHSATQFIDPAGLAGEIEARYASWPQSVYQRVAGGGLGFVTHYCEAKAEPFYPRDFAAAVPVAVETSQPTVFKPISYTRARCTGTEPTYPYWCDRSACMPSTDPAYSQMRGYCFGSDTVFKDSPARCECREPNYTWVTERGTCVPIIDRVWDQPKKCGLNGNVQVGNPVHPLTGVKTDEHFLGAAVAGQTLALVYDNRQKLMRAGAELTDALLPPPSFGELWYSTLHKKLAVQSQRGGSWGAPDSSVAVHRGAGVLETFGTSGGPNYLSAAGGSNELKYDSAVSNWKLSDRAALTQEVYLGNGLLARSPTSRAGCCKYVGALRQHRPPSRPSQDS